jgi:serine/threonine protein kinase
VVQWSKHFSADAVRREAQFYMAYYPDGNLRTVIENSPSVNWDSAFGILAGVAMALVDCHKLGIIHRDIKPENSQ